jgi:hypothetical protein
MAVDLVAHQEHAAVMIFHELAGILFVQLLRHIVGTNLDERATSTVTGRDENLVVPNNRRGNHGNAAREFRFPEQMAIVR